MIPIQIFDLGSESQFGIKESRITELESNSDIRLQISDIEFGIKNHNSKSKSKRDRLINRLMLFKSDE